MAKNTILYRTKESVPTFSDVSFSEKQVIALRSSPGGYDTTGDPEIYAMFGYTATDIEDISSNDNQVTTASASSSYNYPIIEVNCAEFGSVLKSFRSNINITPSIFYKARATSNTQRQLNLDISTKLDLSLYYTDALGVKTLVSTLNAYNKEIHLDQIISNQSNPPYLLDIPSYPTELIAKWLEEINTKEDFFIFDEGKFSIEADVLQSCSTSVDVKSAVIIVAILKLEGQILSNVLTENY